jgi:hypothetical protein
VSDKVARDIRWLKRYTVVWSLMMTGFALATFRPQGAARFEVLGVERLNVVTEDARPEFLDTRGNVVQRLPNRQSTPARQWRLGDHWHRDFAAVESQRSISAIRRPNDRNRLRS